MNGASHLVVYDYGTGGVWAVFTTGDAEEIVRRYPDLKVIADRPAWLTDKLYADLPHYDLDATPDDFLQALQAQRKHPDP